MTTTGSFSGMNRDKTGNTEKIIFKILEKIFLNILSLLLVHMPKHMFWFYLGNMVSGLGANFWGAHTRNSSQIFWYICAWR